MVCVRPRCGDNFFGYHPALCCRFFFLPLVNRYDPGGTSISNRAPVPGSPVSFNEYTGDRANLRGKKQPESGMLSVSLEKKFFLSHLQECQSRHPPRK